MSLECDSAEVYEDAGVFEVCARLTEGHIAIDITVLLSTACGDACSKFKMLQHAALYTMTQFQLKTSLEYLNFL